ncbi:Fc.00g050630.m01.CDS01 [Cosmosporella sp. VM-42]
MLRLGRGLDRSVAYARFYGHNRVSIRPILPELRPYSTSEAPPPVNPSAEKPTTESSDRTSNTKRLERIARRAKEHRQRKEQYAAIERARSLHSTAREREARFEARERSRKSKATLSKESDVGNESPSIAKLSEESTERDLPTRDDAFRQPADRNMRLPRKQSRRAKSKNKDTVKGSQSPIAQSPSNMQEQMQDSGGLSFRVNGDATATTPVLPKMGVWTSLREKLQQMAQASNTLIPDPIPFSQIAKQQEADGSNESEVVKNPTVTSETIDARRKRKVRKAKDANNETASVKVPVKTRKKKAKEELDVKVFRPAELKLSPIEGDEVFEFPKLAHDLDRVLFNPGVYELQDQRSQVYNFDPYLSSIMPNDEFDFNALGEYITSSRDTKLRALTAKHGLKYCGSTSSMTAMFAHFHFLISAWRPPNFGNLSRDLDIEFQSFSGITRGPAAAFARLQDGVYAIDADKEFDTDNILSMLGKSMEKLLTLPKEKFEKYRRSESHQLSAEDKQAGEAYHYTTAGDFMLRSQIDAHDPRLPGTGTFDLKTRAVISIRMDVTRYEKGQDYEIFERTGTWSSYEREYYDMIRTAFLKYSLQVRMGRMDGIFVAFHNTRRIFGFQYVSLEEMDRALHGTTNRRVGDEEFRATLTLFNDVMNRATERFPGKSLRLHVETRPTDPPLTYFFAEPVSEKVIEKTQESGKASVDKIKSQLLEIRQKELELESAALKEESATAGEEVAESQQERSEPAECSIEDGASEEDQGESAWDELMAKVDETVENESSGLQAVRDAIQEALGQSGLLRGKSKEETEVYLNSLVEALTVQLSDNKEMSEESEDVDEDVIDDTPYSVTRDAVNEEASGPEIGPTTTSVGEAMDGVPDATVQGTETTHQPSSEDNTPADGSDKVGTVGSGDPEDDIVRDEVGKSTAQGEPTSDTIARHDPAEADVLLSAGTKSSGPDPSLKDLIIKVAEKVDNKTGDMGTFERVLSDLAAQSKQTELDSQNQESGFETSDITDDVKDDDSNMGSQDPSTSERGEEKRELFGMYITLRNKVNGKFVDRVNFPDTGNNLWDVQYTVTELPMERAWRIYRQLKGRRRKILSGDPRSKHEKWYQLWRGQLEQKTKSGADFRRKMEKRSKGNPVYAAWAKEPIKLPSKKKT